MPNQTQAHQRGYDWHHRRLRAQLLPLAYGTACPRCGGVMLRGMALDLGHSVDRVLGGNSAPRRIEHAACNRRAGARLGNQLRRRTRVTSRSW